MESLIDLENKHILVVGASSGIGRATAVLSGKLGARISAVARRKDELDKTLMMINTSGHQSFSFDISNIDQIQNLVSDIVNRQGSIDGLVYSSGISDTFPLKSQNDERMKRFFDINYFGFMEIIRQVCKNGCFNKGMSIVGVSSTVALLGEKAHSMYAGTKGAMDASVRCLAQELAAKKIRINTVAPGMTNTEMYKHFLSIWREDSEVNQKFLSRQYLGIIEPGDIASAVVFLLSDASKFITGITLPVDGGLTTSC